MLCPFADNRLLSRNDSLQRIVPRLLIMHTAIDGANTTSLRGVFEGSNLASHFYLRKDGGLQQYVDTSRQAAAQFDANPFAISCETWDGAGTSGTVPPWNQAQLDGIDRLARWCHEAHGIPLVIASAWDGSGIGWHSQFAAHWAKDGHTCPTAIRIQQMRDVVLPRLATQPSTGGERVALARNADGRLEEFRVMGGKISHRWQKSPGSAWDAWVEMQTPGNDPGPVDAVAAEANADGRLEVVALNCATGQSWRCWQKGPGQAFDVWIPA